MKEESSPRLKQDSVSDSEKGAQWWNTSLGKLAAMEKRSRETGRGMCMGT